MPGHYIIKRSYAARLYYFVLRADSNQVILSSEQYTSKQAVMAGIAICQAHSQDDHRYELMKSMVAQPFYFALKTEQGEIIGLSDNYATEEGREIGITAVKLNGPTIDIRDGT